MDKRQEWEARRVLLGRVDGRVRPKPLIAPAPHRSEQQQQSFRTRQDYKSNQISIAVSWFDQNRINEMMSVHRNSMFIPIEYKRGSTPPGKWPKPPVQAVGKKPKWNAEGYYEGWNGGKISWDDRAHGSNADRGDGPQGGHWDDKKSGNRWDENGKLLPGSPDLRTQKFEVNRNDNQSYALSPLLMLMLPFPGSPLYGGL
jgi:hypothetical protein